MREFIFSCLALLGFGLLCAPWPAQAGSGCEICQADFGKELFVVEDSIRQIKKHICEKCSKSKMTCSICHLAVNPKTMLKLEDGRTLCELDARGAIFSEEDARTLFNDVKRDVQLMFSHWPPLPDRNIAFHLVSRDQFVREYRRNPGFDDPEKVLGLTRSRHDAETNAEHDIYLLNGVAKAQFMATCAHEYSHAWLYEHAERARKLDKDTVEGFCELMAYRFCALKNETNEIKRLLASEYTHGQIHALIAAEEKYQFHRVISWAQEGVDSWLDKDKLDRLLALKKEDAAPPEFAWPATVAAPVPDTLTLKGISGAAGRRFALINNRTFTKDEEGKVRVGQTNLAVRCLDILENSVLLQINGGAESTELSLPAR